MSPMARRLSANTIELPERAVREQLGPFSHELEPIPERGVCFFSLRRVLLRDDLIRLLGLGAQGTSRGDKEHALDDHLHCPIPV